MMPPLVGRHYSIHSSAVPLRRPDPGADWAHIAKLDTRNTSSALLNKLIQFAKNLFRKLRRRIQKIADIAPI